MSKINIFKVISKIFFIIFLLNGLSACSETGEILLTTFDLKKSNAFDLSELAKSVENERLFSIRKSDFSECILFNSNLPAEKSSGILMMLGVCYDSEHSKLLVFKQFESKLNLKSNGVSEYLKKSESYGEYDSLVAYIEKKLNRGNIDFNRNEPEIPKTNSIGNYKFLK